MKIEKWDLILTHHLTCKLDNASRITVIKNSNPTNILSFTDFISILRHRVQLLQSLQYNTSHQTSRPVRDARSGATSSSRSVSAVAESTICVFCAGSHLLTRCPSFTGDNFSPMLRFQFVKDKRLCGNCLTARHPVSECMEAPCKICSLKHHITLHFRDYQPDKAHRITTSPNATTSNNVTSLLQDVSSNIQVSHHDSNTSHIAAITSNPVSLNSSKLSVSERIILLGTALVNTTASNGNQLQCRALLDSGSHMNFITSEACDRLKSQRYPTAKTISGFGGKESTVKHKTFLTISSRVSAYSTELKLYVLPKITNHIPSSRVNFDMATIPVEIKLADPYFNVPDRIDLLLGVEIYNKLFSGKSITISKELPPLHNTELGYVVCGKAERSAINPRTSHYHVALCNMETLEKQRKQFGELDHIPVKSVHSSENILREHQECHNVTESLRGRYASALPVKSNNKLGSSQLTARRHFQVVEKRLRITHQQCREFTPSYIALCHLGLEIKFYE